MSGLVEDELRGRPRLRQRGHAPALSDGAVLTREIGGEYLGRATDTGRYRSFRRHDGDWFPALRRIDRSTCARQAANLRDEARGWVWGDRNDGRPTAAARRRERDLDRLAPDTWASRDPQPWPQWLTDRRRRVETVIGQLTARYQAKKVGARDAWHLLARWLRKVRSQTIAVLLCQRAGLTPLALDQLVACDPPLPTPNLWQPEKAHIA